MARIHRRAGGTWEVVLELGRDLQTGKRLRRTFTVKYDADIVPQRCVYLRAFMPRMAGSICTDF